MSLVKLLVHVPVIVPDPNALLTLLAAPAPPTIDQLPVRL
jgi:hypothetical protein